MVKNTSLQKSERTTSHQIAWPEPGVAVRPTQYDPIWRMRNGMVQSFAARNESARRRHELVSPNFSPS
jgi:hypothetical protein